MLPVVSVTPQAHTCFMTQQLTLRIVHNPVARIDNHTKRSARIGLQQARAALSEANRRVAEREPELLKLSDAARRLALVASAPQQPRQLSSEDSASEASRSAA